MKKLIILIGILALTLGLFATEVVIGTGTATQRFPLGSFYGFERSAALYTAAEIGPHNSEISAISWYSSIATTAAVPTKIYLKTTSAVTLTTDTWANMIVGAITVFDAPQTGHVAGGWNLYTLMNQFQVDMGDNLIILVERNYGGSGSSTAGGSSAGGGIYSTAMPGTHLTWNADTNPPTTTGTVAANRPNVTLTYTTYTVDTPPNPAILISPTNGATLVRPSSALIWGSGGGSPSGYKIYFGTTSAPPFVQNTTETSYSPTMAVGTTYYWKIIPFNTNGDASACPVWSFSTHGNPGVNTLPYSQNWDALTAPTLPFDWTEIIQSSSTTAVVETYASTTYAHSQPNCARLYNPSDANATLLLVGPPLATNLHANTVRVKFWARASGAGYPLSIGVISNPQDPSTYVEVHNLALTATLAEYVLALSNYTGTGTHIAFKHGLGAAGRTLYIDDIVFEQIAPNDLACEHLSGNTTPSVGNVTTYHATIHNWGTASQSTYTVKLFNGNNVELATANGVTVAPDQSVDVSLAWTPTVEGVIVLYAKVFLAGDINPDNDRSQDLNVLVVGAGTHIVTLGNGTEINGTSGVPTPYGTFYKNFHQQYLYTADEILDEGGGAGLISSIGFNVQAVNNCSPMPNYTIRMKHTQQAALSTTFEVGEYTQVWFQNDFVPVEGWNTHPFTTPFDWDGVSNLLVDIVTTLIPGSYSQNASVYYTPTTGVNSCLRYQSDSVDAATSTTGTVSVNRANVKLSMQQGVLLTNDLAGMSITGSTTPSVGAASNYSVNVRNRGSAAQSTYQVKLYVGNNVEVASAPGLPIQPGETLTVSVPWTPTAEGQQTLYAKVVLATDQNLDNNQTSSMNVLVMGAGTIVVSIGNDTTTNTTSGVPTPYGTYYKNFHQQYLYTAAEILAAGGAPGLVTSISFNVQAVNTCSPMPNYTIKVKPTQQSVLTTTFEVGDYSQVWFQNDFVPVVGWNTHPFTIPFVWDGVSNLLVDIVTTLIPGSFSQNASVYYTPTTGVNSCLRYQNDTLDAAASTTGSVSVNRANIRISLNVVGMGALTGTVSSGGNPLPGASVHIQNTIHTTQTDALGHYNFPFVEPGTYSVTASKLAYETQTFSVTLVADETTTRNFNLTPSSTVNVTGFVVGSDQPTVGLADVAITLDGAMDFTGTTNTSGNFTITGVLSGSAYNYSLVKDGYQNLTGTISVGSTNYSMGTLTMSEIATPPRQVTAAENAAQTQISLTWRSPGSTGGGGVEDFEQDNGQWVSSGYGDWQWGNNYNVANHVDIDTYVDTPPPAAHSGTGMWGTVLMGGYANSGAWSYLKKTFNLSGQTNPVLDFWHYMDGYNTWDYGLIVVNGTTVWGSSAAAVFMPWQNLVIDLSAYANQASVEISFEWYATTTVSYSGWYIDDLYVGPSLSRTVNYTRSNVSEPLPVQAASEKEGAALRAQQVQKANQYSQTRDTRTAPDRIRTGYKVWRLTQGNETDENTWIPLTVNTITDTTYVDGAWASLPDGNYKWAVKAIYTNGVPSLPAFSNMVRILRLDLAATQISGTSTPSVGLATSYQVTVVNTSSTTQLGANYTVKLMSGATQLASANGTNLAAGETHVFDIAWTPTTAGPMAITGKVILMGDTVPDNDSTPLLNISVMGAGTIMVTIGDGTTTNTTTGVPTPYGTFYKNFHQQYLYTAAEIIAAGGGPGLISSVGFNVQAVNNCSPMPNYTIKVMPTQQTVLTTTFEVGDYTQVWFQNDFVPVEGWNTHPFTAPMVWDGVSNLLVDIVTTLIPGAYSQNASVFYTPTTGVNSSLRYQNDSADAGTSTTGTVSVSRANLKLSMNVVGLGILNGTVTGTGGAALQNVAVQFATGGYSATTNAQGQFSIMNILPGAYTINFSVYGYQNASRAVTIEPDETQTLNVAMTPMPMVNVTGTIIGSDTQAGISGAAINLTGYANYTVNSTATGSFTIPGVYANNDYSYNIMAPGYTTANGTIVVGSTNYNMNTITLNEIAYAPHTLLATVNATGTAVELTWQAPDPNAVQITESFEETAFPPQNWTQVITNTGGPTSSGIYNTFCRFGAVTISGQMVTPTEGSYQCGLFWDYAHQDEWLITPSFNCPPAGYLNFDSYVFLGSPNGDHYYVKISTDNGLSWTPIWDASDQTGDWNYYASPINVDLGIYSGMQVQLAFNANDGGSNTGIWHPWCFDNIYIGNAMTEQAAPAVTIRFSEEDLIRKSGSNSGFGVAAVETREASRARENGGTRTENHLPYPQSNRDSRQSGRSLIGYKIWRLASGQEGNESIWTQLTPEIINVPNLSDPAWQTLPNGTYRWAVKAFYTNSVASVPSFSNPLDKFQETGMIAGVVRRINTVPIQGATVTAGGNSATTNSVGAYTLILPIGTYDVTCSATGYQNQTSNGIVVSPSQTTTLNFIMAVVSNEDEVVPVTATALLGNYPNPFNPETTISYCLKEASPVRIEIYNSKGQRVRTLIDETKASGWYQTVWNGSDDNGNTVSSGIYMYRMSAGNYLGSRKMILMQ